MIILFEDNHLFIVSKPGGISTQGENSLEEQAKLYIKVRDLKPGNVFLHAVHRLDKAASGIVVFAKSQKALSRLSKTIREHMWHKEYCAIVERTQPSIGQYENWLAHGSHKAVLADQSSGKQALLSITSVYCIAPQQWWITIDLQTGRYHQIRAQCSAHGFPIVGDSKYGSATSTIAICLHHTTCSFPHPISHEPMTVTSQVPFQPIMVL